MPIKRLTDSNAGSMPCLGRLRKGDIKQEGSDRPGKDLTHFRIDFAEPYAHLLPVWESLYTSKPERFEGIYLLGETVQSVFPSWMEEYNASGVLLRRCDGETQVRHFDPTEGRHSDSPVKCATPACKCTEYGRLKLIFQDFMIAAGVVGYIGLVLGSYNEIKETHEYLSGLQNMTGAPLNSIPFIIGRAPRKISVPTKDPGKRIKTTKSLVYLYAAPDKMTELMMSKHAQITAGDHEALPPPEGETVPFEVDEIISRPFFGDDLKGFISDLYLTGIKSETEKIAGHQVELIRHEIKAAGQPVLAGDRVSNLLFSVDLPELTQRQGETIYRWLSEDHQHAKLEVAHLLNPGGKDA